MSRNWRVSIAVGVALGAVWLAGAGEQSEKPKSEKPKKDAELGLSKTSVFSTPEPIVPATQAKDPGENKTKKAYFPGAPPMIPHLIEDSLPILVGQNMCIDCHELPDSIGAKRMPGEPTPAPKSHYTDLRRNPNTVKKRIIGARYFCVQCHAPQTDAKPLVENTFGR